MNASALPLPAAIDGFLVRIARYPSGPTKTTPAGYPQAKAGIPHRARPLKQAQTPRNFGQTMRQPTAPGLALAVVCERVVDRGLRCLVTTFEVLGLKVTE